MEIIGLNGQITEIIRYEQKKKNNNKKRKIKIKEKLNKNCIKLHKNTQIIINNNKMIVDIIKVKENIKRDRNKDNELLQK